MAALRGNWPRTGNDVMANRGSAVKQRMKRPGSRALAERWPPTCALSPFSFAAAFG
jgi:hypothetical protein